jgi:hypothetical protein
MIILHLSQLNYVHLYVKNIKFYPFLLLFCPRQRHTLGDSNFFMRLFSKRNFSCPFPLNQYVACTITIYNALILKYLRFFTKKFRRRTFFTLYKLSRVRSGTDGTKVPDTNLDPSGRQRIRIIDLKYLKIVFIRLDKIVRYL